MVRRRPRLRPCFCESAPLHLMWCVVSHGLATCLEQLRVQLQARRVSAWLTANGRASVAAQQRRRSVR